MPRFILGVMHPRRLEFFLNSVKKLNFVDKVFAENMSSTEAAETLRRYVLNSGYDYLILTSDDVVISEYALKEVIKAVLFHSYPITTGWSLVRPNMKLANITLFPPKNIESKLNKPLYLHEYGFMPTRMLDEDLKRGVKTIQVWFTGFSLTAIRRDVLENWEVRGWFFHQHPTFTPQEHRGLKGFWSGLDLWFSYDTWRKGYKKLCVLDAYIDHRPVGYSHGWSELRVGREEPRLRFEAAEALLTL